MMAWEIRALYGVAVDTILGSRSEMSVRNEVYDSDAWRKIRRTLTDPTTGKMLVRRLPSSNERIGFGDIFKNRASPKRSKPNRSKRKPS